MLVLWRQIIHLKADEGRFLVCGVLPSRQIVVCYIAARRAVDGNVEGATSATQQRSSCRPYRMMCNACWGPLSFCGHPLGVSPSRHLKSCKGDKEAALDRADRLVSECLKQFWVGMTALCMLHAARRLHHGHLRGAGQAARPCDGRRAQAGHAGLHRQGLPARAGVLRLRDRPALPHAGPGLLPLRVRPLAGACPFNPRPRRQGS